MFFVIPVCEDIVESGLARGIQRLCALKHSNVAPVNQLMDWTFSREFGLWWGYI